MPQADYRPKNLDVRHPDFVRDMQLWSLETRCEIQEIVAVSRDTIATTRALIVHADRLLAAK